MDKEKKDSTEETELTYTVQGDTFAGSWAPAYENMTVSYDGSNAGDINEMMRQDAGKGFGGQVGGSGDVCLGSSNYFFLSLLSKID